MEWRLSRVTWSYSAARRRATRSAFTATRVCERSSAETRGRGSVSTRRELLHCRCCTAQKNIHINFVAPAPRGLRKRRSGCLHVNEPLSSSAATDCWRTLTSALSSCCNTCTSTSGNLAGSGCGGSSTGSRSSQQHRRGSTQLPELHQRRHDCSNPLFHLGGRVRPKHQRLREVAGFWR